MTATPARLVGVLVGAVLLPAWGCGGGSPGDEPAASTADTATADTALAAPDKPMPDRTTPDDPTPGEPAGDTGGRVGERAPGPSLPEWTTGPVDREGARPVGVLRGARAGGHEGYDRFVLEFAGGIPGFTVGWADGPLNQCGSGRPIDVGAPAALRIELRPAAAHDDRGEATVEERHTEPRLAAIRTARLTCDYEATVEWVLGTVARSEIRVFTVPSPARLVVDVRHP